MDITLDQARALNAIAETNSITGAADRLGKRHSAIIYAIKELETQTGLALLDRTQYRSSLTASGRRVLEACKSLLLAEGDLYTLCRDLQRGLEPKLKIYYEPSFPVRVLFGALGALRAQSLDVDIQVEVLPQDLAGLAIDDKETVFVISVRPFKDWKSLPYPPYNLCLVGKPGLDSEAAAALRVRDMSWLEIPGDQRRTSMRFAQYEPLVQALRAGLGVGWAPEHLVCEDLKRGSLILVDADRNRSVRSVFPGLYYPSAKELGLAGRAYLRELGEAVSVPPCVDCGRSTLEV